MSDEIATSRWSIRSVGSVMSGLSLFGLMSWRVRRRILSASSAR